MIGSLILLLGVIINVALLTLAERKVMGSLQRRIGPNKVGFLGLLQPFSDGFKLILKEQVIPAGANRFFFLFSPYLFFYLALIQFLVLPLNNTTALAELVGAGLLIIVAISELSIYGVLYSGWSSNSKYPLLGALRSTAQMISYSVSLSLILLTVIITVGSVDLLQIISSQSNMPLMIPLLPIGIMFIISAVAETSRAPMDFQEAESELVSGFNTEHGGISFAFFFLAEYSHMLFLSTLFFVLFFGISMSLPFLFFFFWLRASLPRMRLDHLLSLGWIHFLPFIIGYLLFLPPFLYTFDMLA
jgi:NADH-quinone oxidoreductase subunit H